MKLERGIKEQNIEAGDWGLQQALFSLSMTLSK